MPRPRIRSLDGLRAIAVLAVVFGHALNHALGTEGSAIIRRVPFLGVGLFFAISGFLITRLLVIERETAGHIFLWRFYARRIVRLWPALWLLVGVTALLDLAGYVATEHGDALATLLFVSNYVGPHSSALFHTWSLGIEEQFYLLWPAVLLAIGMAKGKRALIVAVALAPVVRVAAYVAVPQWRDAVEYQFHTRYDVIACGCLLALYWDHERARAFIARHQARIAAAAIGLLFGVEIVSASLPSAAFMLVFGYTLQSVALAAIVATAITAADSRTGRLLNRAALVHLGVISYSLYLWQQMFVVTPFGIFEFAPLGLLAAFVAAELSWRVAERPFEVVRRSLHPSPAPLTEAEPEAAAARAG